MFFAIRWKQETSSLRKIFWKKAMLHSHCQSRCGQMWSFKNGSKSQADKTSSQGRDLAILASCNHTILSYGTYGFWGGFLAGHGKGIRSESQVDSDCFRSRESFMSFSPVGEAKRHLNSQMSWHICENNLRQLRLRLKWTFLWPLCGGKARLAPGGDIEKEDYSSPSPIKSISQ